MRTLRLLQLSRSIPLPAVLGVALASVAGVAAGDLGLPAVARVARCAGEVVVDGRIGEECWQRAVRLGPFVDIRDHALAQEQTTGRILWDDTSLYIALDCRESQMENLLLQRTERDADGLWMDDSVEIFVQPPLSEQFFHFIVNAAGVLLDELCPTPGQFDPTWNTRAIAATLRGDKGWQCEIVIPWADIGGPPKLGQAWRINLNREEKRLDEWSGWSPTLNGFHEPENFGVVIFDESPPAVGLCRLDEPFLGVNEARFQPLGPFSAGLTVALVGAGEILGTEPMPHADCLSVRYRVAQTGAGSVAFEVREGNRLILRTGALPYYIEPVDARLAELDAASAWWRGQASRPVPKNAPEALTAAAAVLDADLKALTARCNRAMAQDAAAVVQGTAREAWAQLAREVEDLAVRIGQLDTRWRTWEAMGGGDLPDYGIGVAPSTVKVLRDVPFAGKLGLVGRLRLCRNEYEAIQFVIIPVAKDLEDVEVTWTPLVGPQGFTIGRDRIEVYRVGYVQTRKPRYPVEYVGWYPDPLMPLDRFDGAQGQNQPIWVGVKAPKDVPAGVYVGGLTVSPANARPVNLKLEVEVWDVTLPDTTTLKTAISSWHTGLAAWYGLKETPPELKRRYFQFLLDRRINPGTIYSGNPYWDEDDIRWCVDHGMNAFCVKYQGGLGGGTPEERAARDAELAKWAREYAEFLRRNGWIDKGYVYGFDEVRPEGYDEVVRAYSVIKKAAPDLRTACTVVPNEVLNPVMDTWVPLTPHLENPRIWRNVDKTDEMWWYVCCGPTHPYANWFTDYSALEHRILFWQTYRYRVTGFLYYHMQMWQSNEVTKPGPDYIVPMEDPEVLAQIAAGKRWPEVPWNTFTYDHVNGDGHLFYPGPDQTLISCQRLENIRDGIEDYELLHELELATDRLADALRERGIRPDAPQGVRAGGERTDEHPVGGESASPQWRLVSEARQLLGWRPELFRDLTHWTDDPEVLEAERARVASQLARVRRALARIEGRE